MQRHLRAILDAVVLATLKAIDGMAASMQTDSFVIVTCQPTTGLEAKFSAPYCAAAAWVDGAVGLGSFTDEAVLRADLRKQMIEVVVAEREGSHEPLEFAPVRVTVEADGEAETLLVDWAPGSLQDEVSDDDLFAKWADCLLQSGIALDSDVAVSLMESPMAKNIKECLSAIKTALQRHAAKAMPEHVDSSA